MGDDDALADEMRRPLASSRPTPPALDRDTADRLFAGRLGPGDAPAGCAAVARLLAAATAPPSADELAGERAAVAEFAAAAHSHPPTPAPRRAAMARRRFGVKAAVVAVAAVLTIGGAAAATGVLPGSAHRATDPASANTRGRSAADTGQGTTGPQASGPAGSATTRQRGAAIGPDAGGPARHGLCRAWLAGNGGQRGKRDDSTAFQALARAAGGADEIAAYCQAGGAGRSAGHGRQDPPPTTNPPADPPPGDGGGQGKGRPPTTS